MSVKTKQIKIFPVTLFLQEEETLLSSLPQKFYNKLGGGARLIRPIYIEMLQYVLFGHPFIKL